MSFNDLPKMHSEQLMKLEHTAMEFSSEMHQKLKKKFDEGFTGWDGEGQWNKGSMLSQLKAHVCKTVDNFAISFPEDFVDIANFAMFNWYLRKKEKEKEGVKT